MLYWIDKLRENWRFVSAVILFFLIILVLGREYIEYFVNLHRATFDLFGALLTPLIAVLAIYIAFQQKNINEKRLKFKLFEKRFEVYESIMDFIGWVLTTGGVSYTESMTKEEVIFLEKTNASWALFSHEVEQFIKDVNSTFQEIKEREKLLITKTNQTEREKLATQIHDFRESLRNQWTESKKIFEKDLRID